MTLSKLPREITDKIANLLSFDDKVSCTLVCKTWKEIFQSFVYSHLEINRMRLENIVDPHAQDDQQLYQNNRYLVEVLALKRTLRATDEEFYTLQKTFPNVKAIILHPYCLSQDKIGVMADWNLWGLLRELEFCFGDSIMYDLENGLAKIAKCLPRLRRLNIRYMYNPTCGIPVSLNTIEVLHSHLNHLDHLGLGLNLSPFSKTDVELIPSVSPATEITSLHIYHKYTNYRWLYYFARKYPNLHTLKFSPGYVRADDSDDDDIEDAEQQRDDNEHQRIDAIELFRKTPLLFQHLAELDILYYTCIDEECLLLWDIIDFHDVPLKTIKIESWVYDTNRCWHICDVFNRIIAICLSKYSKTIESFVIKGANMNMPALNFVEIKDRLYNLVNLEIKLPTTGGIDTLLCAAPQLKSLLLHDSDIKVENEVCNSSRFGLQSFRVLVSTITSESLQFLSFHCRSLNSMALVSTKVRGSFTTPGLQLIDMSYTHLQSLNVSGTMFIIQDNRRSYEKWNIILITDTLDDISPKQDTDPKPLPVVIGDTSRKPWNLWLYSRYVRDMCYLSRSKGSRVERFVKNYERNKRITIEKGIHEGRGRRSDYWNKECISGYTKLKIGYIANVITTEKVYY